MKNSDYNHQRIYPKWESSAMHPDQAIEQLGLQYEDYQKDDRLADLLKDKRIALVCPSPHLNRLKLGKVIDKYDLVIRVGPMAPIPEPLHEDCGSRTDIIIHSFNQFEIEQAKRNIEYISQMRFVMCAMVSYDYLAWHNEFIQQLSDLGTPAQNVNDSYLYRQFKEVGTTCNVGFAGLLTLLHYDFKEIYVAGMGFYNMGHYGNIYNSDYYKQVTDGMKIFTANEERTITAGEARADLHRQQPQIDYLKRLIRRDKRIKVDSYLLYYLEQDISYVSGRYLFIDIDGILCISDKRYESGLFKGELDYNYSTPLINNIDLVNELYEHNRITIWTARGQRTGKIDWREFTIAQLKDWGVNYHEIRFDKPHFDMLWDDKSAFDKKSFIEQLKTIK